MSQVSKEQSRQARITDLYEFLVQHHYGDFYDDGTSLHPRNNRSLSIRRGYSGYMDFGNDEHGNSVDFLMKHMHYSFVDAVLALCGEGSPIHNDTYVKSPSITKKNDIKENTVEFPKPTEKRFNKLFAYLMSRGISSGTIQMLIDKKIMYQDEQGNIIFINPEKDWGERRGTNTYADNRCSNMKGCDRYKEMEHGWCAYKDYCEIYKKSSFHGIIKGSRADGVWYFTAKNKKPEKIYVCEAAIDAISLYELHRMKGISDNSAYFSLGGVGKQSAIDRLKTICKPILALDNDNAGDECRRRNAELEAVIPIAKDWNEDLMIQKQFFIIPIKKEEPLCRAYDT